MLPQPADQLAAGQRSRGPEHQRQDLGFLPLNPRHIFQYDAAAYGSSDTYNTVVTNFGVPAKSIVAHFIHSFKPNLMNEAYLLHDPLGMEFLHLLAFQGQQLRGESLQRK